MQRVNVNILKNSQLFYDSPLKLADMFIHIPVITSIKGVCCFFLLWFKYSCPHFPTTAFPYPTNSHLPPSVLPPFGFVHGSFIHVPWWFFPFFPLLSPARSPLVLVSLFFISFRFKYPKVRATKKKSCNLFFKYMPSVYFPMAHNREHCHNHPLTETKAY